MPVVLLEEEVVGFGGSLGRSPRIRSPHTLSEALSISCGSARDIGYLMEVLRKIN